MKLGESLMTNKALTRLDLSRKHQKNLGTQKMTKQLASIAAHYKGNAIGSYGLLFISQSLRYNTTLIELHLECLEESQRGKNDIKQLCFSQTTVNDIEGGVTELANTLTKNKTLTCIDLLGWQTAASIKQCFSFISNLQETELGVKE